MATIQEIIRRIFISARTEGLSKAEGELRKVSEATTQVDKATLSMKSRIDSLQKSLDADYRAEAQLAKVKRELEAATKQGLITQERANSLSLMAADRYRVQGESAKKAAEGLKLMKEMSIGFVGGIGAGMVAGGIADLPNAISEAVEKLGAIGNTAQTIGITTKALQELHYAARLSDVEVGTLDEALTKFSTNLGKTDSPLRKLLEINKVKVSGDLLTDLERFADLVKNAANQEQRNVIVTTAFGKSAQEMGRLFEDGGRGIASWAREANAAGAVIDDGTVQRARELNDQMESLKPRLEAAQAQFAVLVVPAEIAALESLNNRLRDTLGLLTDIGNGDWGGVFTKLSQFGPILAGAMSGNLSGALALHDAQSKVLDITVHGGGGNGGWGDARSDLFKPPAKVTKLPTPPDTAAKQRQAAIDRVTDSLKEQLKALSETDRQAYIDQQLSAAKVTAASKEGKAIEALAGKYYDQKKAIEDYSQVAITFTQTLLGDLKQGKSAWESFADAAVAAIDQIAQQMIVTGITKLVAQLVTGGIGGATIPSGGYYPGITGPRLHEGGVVGSGGTPVTYPAAVWTGAPRYHGGGIAGLKPDEVPAILQAGEVVVPKWARNVANGNGGGVVINFHNVSKADIPDLNRWASQELSPKLQRAQRHPHRKTL